MTSSAWAPSFSAPVSDVQFQAHPDAEHIDSHRLYLKPVDQAAHARLRSNLDIHAALPFYSGAKIARKIAGLQSADGHSLIEERPDCYIVWDTDEQKQRVLQKICATIDDQNHTQICATYDIAHKDLTFHFGGTDFSNIDDLWSATQSAFGGLNPRAKDGTKYAHMAVRCFQQLHPETDLQDLNVQIIGHSSGATTALVAKHVMEQYTGNAVDTVLFDPFGAQTTLETLSRTTGLSEQKLSENVTTIKGHWNPLHAFKKAAQTIGELVHIDMDGHFGKDFVNHFGRERHTRRSAKLHDPLSS